MIAFEGFTKRFGAHTAVDALTLRVERGEALALLGPNGSGKTTSLKGAAGLLRPTTGAIRLGHDRTLATDTRGRALASFLPQRVGFPEALTGREVVEFYRALRSVPAGRTDEVLKFASLNGSGDRAVGTYSGGMVQRLGLAVAVLPDAPVLLLDEPTAALDPDGLCAFYGLVDRRKQHGQTVLFTSHQLGDVERLADRIAVVVAGRLVANLSQRELVERLADRGVMRLLVDGADDGLLARVRTLEPRAVRAGEELVVPGPAAMRPAIIDLVRAHGATIRGLTAQEGRLDEFYRELVADRP
ncbi:MAG: ABC transporter ATP-binding protein [Vicinamibacterales bacterium]